MTTHNTHENAAVAAYARGWRQTDDGSWWREGTAQDAFTVHHTDDESEYGTVIASTPEDAVRIDRETFFAPKEVQGPPVAWPKRPDGSNMTIGEMTPQQKREQFGAAALRVEAEFRTPSMRAAIARALED